MEYWHLIWIYVIRSSEFISLAGRIRRWLKTFYFNYICMYTCLWHPGHYMKCIPYYGLQWKTSLKGKDFKKNKTSHHSLIHLCLCSACSGLLPGAQTNVRKREKMVQDERHQLMADRAPIGPQALSSRMRCIGLNRELCERDCLPWIMELISNWKAFKNKFPYVCQM